MPFNQLLHRYINRGTAYIVLATLALVAFVTAAVSASLVFAQTPSGAVAMELSAGNPPGAEPDRDPWMVVSGKSRYRC